MIKLLRFLFLCSISSLFFSCTHDGINNGVEAEFTSEGCLVHRLPVADPKKPAGVNVFLETSGSMFGFMPAGNATRFQTDVWAVVSSFDNEFGQGQKIFEIVEKNKPIISLTGDSFRTGINSGKFQSSRSTDIPEMLDSIIKRTPDNTVSLLISDLIFSPEDHSAPKLDQITSDIESIFKKNRRGSIIYAMKSQFFGKYARPDNSPYYIWAIGDEAQLDYVGRLIRENLKNFDEIRYGKQGRNIAYSILPYEAKNTNATAVICGSDHKSYALSDFEESDSKQGADIVFALDLSSLPLYARTLDYIRNNIIISAQNAKSHLVSVDTLTALAFQKDNEIVNNIHATHIVRINVTGINGSNTVIKINLKNKQPGWVEMNNSELDDNSRMRTCGLKKMITGLDLAYQPQEFWFTQPLQFLISKNTN